MYFEQNGIIDGKPSKEKINIIFSSPDEQNLDVTELVDGKVTGTYKEQIKRVK